MIAHLLLFLVTSCSLETVKEQTYLHYQNLSTTVSTLGPNSKIESCKIFPQFKNILVAEVNLGSSGTSSIHEETDLLIYRIEKKSLKLVFQKTIGSTSVSYNEEKKENEEIGFKREYKLEKTKDGKPAIRWLPSQKIDVL